MADAVYSLVERFRRLDACGVSDAVDQLANEGVAAGAVATGVPQASGSGLIAGRAVTMRVGPGSPPPGPPRHLGTRAIEAAGPDDIIVVEQSSGIDAGCWGGLLSTGARMRGIAGVVADGPVRDIDEAQELNFPIFTHKLTARTARGRVVELEQGAPVTLFGHHVEPGDYIVADRSAVVIVAQAHAEAVCAKAEAICAREASMARAIMAGTPIGKVMGGDYEHMLEKN